MDGRERARALELRERYPHAREVLRLDLALTEVWERAEGVDTLERAAATVLPRVMEATVTAGPRPLADAMAKAEVNGGAVALLAAWVADEELTPVERYLARATMHAVPLPPRAGGACPAGRCPACGGPPQLSYRTASEDPLVSGRRMLACAKCRNEWSFSATTCPNCGESGQRTVHAEARPRTGPHGGSAAPARRTGPRVGREEPAEGVLFPHLRAESCRSCRRYLIDIDLGRDPGAVPGVDELAAIPLDLHLTGLGHTKITPNLMGF